jgi:hypothetical protein
MSGTLWVVATNSADLNTIGAFSSMSEALQYAKKELVGFCWDIKPLRAPTQVKKQQQVKHPSWC